MLAAPTWLFVTFASKFAWFVANTSGSMSPSLYHCDMVARKSRNSAWSGPYFMTPFSWYQS